MPIVHITIVEGRSDELVTQCVKAVAHTIHDTLGVPLEAVRVYATQVPTAHWAIGGRTYAELERSGERAAPGGKAP